MSVSSILIKDVFNYKGGSEVTPICTALAPATRVKKSQKDVVF